MVTRREKGEIEICIIPSS